MIDCEFREQIGGQPCCRQVAVAAQLPVVQCHVKPDACRACLASGRPKQPNHVVASIALKHVRETALEQLAERERELRPLLKREGPSAYRRAANLGRAVARHALDRGRKVEDSTYEIRLAICRQCEFCDVAQIIFRHERCSSRLKIKGRWRSEDCPMEKWPTLDAESALDAAATWSELLPRVLR